MKKCSMILFLACLMSAKAFANLAIFPQSLDFVEESRQRSQTINVVNQADKPQTYRVSLIHYAQDENGKHTEVEKTENMADKFLVFSPKQFTLAPGKIQSIRVARKSMGDAKDGEYLTYLKISEVEMPYMKAMGNTESDSETDDEEKKISINIHMLFASSIPVTIYKGKNLVQKTDVLSVKKNGNKLDLILQRKGNIASRLSLKVLDAQGTEIGSAGPIRILTPNGKRYMTVPLKEDAKPVKLELYNVLSNEKLMEKAL